MLWKHARDLERGALTPTVSDSTLLYIYTNVTQFAVCSEHCTACKRQPVSLYIIKIAQTQPHFAFARYHSTVLVKNKGKKKTGLI